MIDFVQLKKVAQEAQESQVPFTINSTQILELMAVQDKLVNALRQAQGDINWMLNSKKFLNGFTFEYIIDALSESGAQP